VTTFAHKPGIYYEKIGKMQQVESAWKLAIKIDVTAIAVRTQQLNNFINEAEGLCRKLQGRNKQICESTAQIINKDNLKINILDKQIKHDVPNTRYKMRPNKCNRVHQ